MPTLNPELLSKDLDAVMNDAVALKHQFKKRVLMPELLLLAILNSKDTAAARLLDVFKNSRGVDLDSLKRQAELAAENGYDQGGNLDFAAVGNRHVPLSRQMVILIDDALSLANAQNETRVDTDHVLSVLARSTISTSDLLHQHGIIINNEEMSVEEAILTIGQDLYNRKAWEIVSNVENHKQVLGYIIRTEDISEKLFRRLNNALNNPIESADMLPIYSSTMIFRAKSEMVREAALKEAFAVFDSRAKSERESGQQNKLMPKLEVGKQRPIPDMKQDPWWKLVVYISKHYSDPVVRGYALKHLKNAESPRQSPIPDSTRVYTQNPETTEQMFAGLSRERRRNEILRRLNEIESEIDSNTVTGVPELDELMFGKPDAEAVESTTAALRRELQFLNQAAPRDKYQNSIFPTPKMPWD